MKNTSKMFPDLKVGTRVQANYADSRGIVLRGRIVGFKDIVDFDAMEYNNCSEQEATVEGGAFVVELDKSCRPRIRLDDGSIREVTERDVDWECAEEFWEVEHD